MTNKTKKHIEEIKKIVLGATIASSGLTAQATETQPVDREDFAIEASAYTPEINPETTINYSDAIEQMNYRVDSKDQRITDFCENHNIVRMEKAPREIRKKLNKKEYSDAYLCYKQEVIYRYGEAYIKEIPAQVICIPHNPHKELAVYQSVRLALETAENSNGAFCKNRNSHSQSGYYNNGYYDSDLGQTINDVGEAIDAGIRLVRTITGKRGR